MTEIKVSLRFWRVSPKHLLHSRVFSIEQMVKPIFDEHQRVFEEEANILTIESEILVESLFKNKAQCRLPAS